jgi:hypothetical protein
MITANILDNDKAHNYAELEEDMLRAFKAACL